MTEYTLNNATSLIQKITPFTGKKCSIDIKTFIERIELISKISKWNKSDTIAITKLSLEGDALKFLINNIAADTTDWDVLKTELINYFAPPRDSRELENELNSCRQYKNESVEEYVERLKPYEKNLIPKCETDAELKVYKLINDSKLLDQLIDGILPELKRPVLSANPKSFKEAVEVAILAQKIEKRLTITDESIFAVKNSTYSDNENSQRDRARRYNKGYRSNGDYGEEDQHFSKPLKEERQFDNQQTHITGYKQLDVTNQNLRKFGNFHQRENANLKFEKSPYNDNNGDDWQRNVMCFFCGKMGHIQKFCYKKKNAREEPTSRKCTRCGANHRTINCKTPPEHLN